MMMITPLRLETPLKITVGCCELFPSMMMEPGIMKLILMID